MPTQDERDTRRHTRAGCDTDTANLSLRSLVGTTTGPNHRGRTTHAKADDGIAQVLELVDRPDLGSGVLVA